MKLFKETRYIGIELWENQSCFQAHFSPIEKLHKLFQIVSQEECFFSFSSLVFNNDRLDGKKTILNLPLKYQSNAKRKFFDNLQDNLGVFSSRKDYY